MKPVRLIAFGVIAMWALPLMAILPPDAQFRRQEIVQQRMRARVEYAQQREEYGKEVIAARARTEAAMREPPWKRVEGSTVRGIAAAELTLKTDVAPEFNHRLLVSVMLLILIGAVVGWVRYATREADE